MSRSNNWRKSLEAELREALHYGNELRVQELEAELHDLDKLRDERIADLVDEGLDENDARDVVAEEGY